MRTFPSSAWLSAPAAIAAARSSIAFAYHAITWGGDVSPALRAGRNPAELSLRERTGCSVVAVERGDEVIVDLGPGFRFQPQDAVYICGSNNALRRFREVFGR